MFLLVILVQATELNQQQPDPEAHEVVQKYIEEEQLKVKITAKVKYENKKVKVKK